MPTCPYQLKYIIQQRGYILFCWWSAWTVDGVRTDLQTAHLAFTPDLRACSFLRLAKDFMTCWKVSALYSSYYACEVIIYWEKRCLLFLELARVSTIHISFESRILSDLCQVFGVKKSRTTPYHPMGDGLVEQMNRSLLSLLRSHVDRNRDWGRNTFNCHSSCIRPHVMRQLDCPFTRFCLEPTPFLADFQHARCGISWPIRV